MSTKSSGPALPSTPSAANPEPPIACTDAAGEPDSIVRLVRPLGIGYAVEDFSRDCFERLIDFPEMPLRAGTREAVKTGRTAQVVRTELPVGGRLLAAAYKRVLRRNWLKRISALPRRNRTLHAWQMGRLFRACKINTARPLAVIIPRRHDLTRPSYLATAWIEGGVSLQAFHRRLSLLDPRTRAWRLRKAAASLGTLIGRMHSQNISHRDLKPGNILFIQDGDRIESYIVDLDGARRQRKVSRRVRLRNIARVLKGVHSLSDIGLAVRLTFLQAYVVQLHNGIDSTTLRTERQRTWRQLAATLPGAGR